MSSTGSLGNLFQDLPTLVVKNLAWLDFPLLQLVTFVSCPLSVHFWEGSGFLFNNQPLQEVQVCSQVLPLSFPRLNKQTFITLLCYVLQPSNPLGGPLGELSSVFQHLCLTGISTSAGEIRIISPLAAEVRRISAHA